MPTYIVIQDCKLATADDEILRERLIDAPTKAGAIRFVADETITAELAETADIIRLAQAGINLEKAE